MQHLGSRASQLLGACLRTCQPAHRPGGAGLSFLTKRRSRLKRRSCLLTAIKADRSRITNRMRKRASMSMEYVNLGKTGLKVSRICLGCMSYGEVPTVIRPGSHAWALNEEQSQPFFKQALDLGINFWDTANVYSMGSSEELVGKFLKANTRRENMVIATKLHAVMRDDPNGKGLSRKEIFFELDQSLQRLQTEYVDLYQIHSRDYDADRGDGGGAARCGEIREGTPRWPAVLGKRYPRGFFHCQ